MDATKQTFSEWRDELHAKNPGLQDALEKMLDERGLEKDEEVRAQACIAAMAGIDDPAAFVASHERLREAGENVLADWTNVKTRDKLREALAAVPQS